MIITASQICTTGQEVEQGKVYTYVEIPVKGENYTADVEVQSIVVKDDQLFSIRVRVVSCKSNYLPIGFFWSLKTDIQHTINKEDLGGTWQLIDKENSH